jgi:hypothetical protein
MFVSLIVDIYEIRCWDGFTWHDIDTKVHEDLYKRSRNIKVLHKKFDGL